MTLVLPRSKVLAVTHSPFWLENKKSFFFFLHFFYFIVAYFPIFIQQQIAHYTKHSLHFHHAIAPHSIILTPSPPQKNNNNPNKQCIYQWQLVQCTWSTCTCTKIIFKFNNNPWTPLNVPIHNHAYVHIYELLNNQITAEERCKCHHAINNNKWQHILLNSFLQQGCIHTNHHFSI